jgi:hypothetical protein
VGAGVYCLLGPVDDANEGLRLYVGHSPGNARHRLLTQRAPKEWWSTAVVCRSAATTEMVRWTSADARWLEAALYREVVSSGEYGRVTNVQPPRDDSIGPFRSNQLRAVLAPVGSILRLLGLPYVVEVEREECDRELALEAPRWLDCAEAVLRAAPDAMTVAQIVAGIRDAALRPLTATPAQTLRRDLSNAIARGDGRFERVGTKPLRFRLVSPARRATHR